MREYQNVSRCPICQTPNAWVDTDAELVVRCKTCANTSMIDTTPMFYQMMYIYDRHPVLSFAGAYGTGKTFTSSLKLFLTYISVPNSTSVVMSGTIKQLEATFYADLLNVMPRSLMRNKKPPKLSGSGNNKLTLVNNHEVLFLPSDDEGKIKSLNTVTIHMEEASEIDETIFDQTLARMRAASKGSGVIKTDELSNLRAKYTQISLTTNPSDDWTYNEAIGRAIKPVNLTDYPLPKTTALTDRMFGSIIVPSQMNRYLPDGFIESMKTKYSEVEYKTNVLADFKFKMGRIIPNVDGLVVEDLRTKVDLSKMPRIYGLDFGQGDKGDNQAFLETRIDFENKRLYVTNEVVHTDNVTVAKKVKDYNVVIGTDYSKVIGIYYDAIHGAKDRSGHGEKKGTIAQMYRDAGLKKLYPASNSKSKQYGVIDRTEILKTWAEEGSIIIDSSCSWLIKELKGWSYDPKIAGRPVDKDNHCIDALVFVILVFGKLSTFQEMSYKEFIRPLITSQLKYDGISTGYSNPFINKPAGFDSFMSKKNKGGVF